jgi:hypothetical protein
MADASIIDRELDEATDGYLQAAVFTATDEHGESLDNCGHEWSKAAILAARSDMADFIALCDGDELAWRDSMSAEQLGIDFWLTRNRHGAGFWDRNLGKLGDDLTAAAHSYGGADVYLSDAGELEFM